jgi:hypothetical protein
MGWNCQGCPKNSNYCQESPKVPEESKLKEARKHSAIGQRKKPKNQPKTQINRACTFFAKEKGVSPLRELG